jgi:hypothetical protein
MDYSVRALLKISTTIVPQAKLGNYFPVSRLSSLAVDIEGLQIRLAVICLYDVFVMDEKKSLVIRDASIRRIGRVIRT